MQKTTRLVSILFLFVLVSCKGINGSLSVSEDLTFNRTTIFGNEREVRIEAGDHVAKVYLGDGKKDFRLKVKGKKKIEFELPEDFYFPSETNENFSLTSEQTGQPYDLNVEVKRDSYNTEPREETETCVSHYTYRHRDCDMRCWYDDLGRHECERVCDVERIPHYGTRLVKYYYKVTEDSLYVDMLLTGSNVEVASFQGGDSKRKRKYEFYGDCR